MARAAEFAVRPTVHAKASRTGLRSGVAEQQPAQRVRVDGDRLIRTKGCIQRDAEPAAELRR
jgi:hypothetical protein